MRHGICITAAHENMTKPMIFHVAFASVTMRHLSWEKCRSFRSCLLQCSKHQNPRKTSTPDCNQQKPGWSPFHLEDYPSMGENSLSEVNLKDLKVLEGCCEDSLENLPEGFPEGFS